MKGKNGTNYSVPFLRLSPLEGGPGLQCGMRWQSLRLFCNSHYSRYGRAALDCPAGTIRQAQNQAGD